MKIQNNYILLRKANSKSKSTEKVDEKGNHVIHLDIPVNLKTLLNKAFDLKEEVWDSDKLHLNYKASFALVLNNIENNITFEVFEVLGDCYFNVEVNGTTKSQCVKILEHINYKLHDPENKIEKSFTIIISYDAISEFYCNKIFAKLSRFERLFRRLLLNIYVLNYGNDYYKRTISEDIINKAKGNIRPKNQKEERYLKEFFYSLDYNDLHNILFTPNWTSEDETNKQNFLSKYKDLSALSDDELRKFIQGIGAKSDWERLFESKIKITSLKEDLDFIRLQRNKVAHSKFFTYSDYIQSLKTLRELLKAVDEAIVLTQDEEFWKKNVFALQENVQGLSETFKKFSTKISESFMPFLETQTRISDMFKPLTDTITANLKLFQPKFESIPKSFSSLPKFDVDELNGEVDFDFYNDNDDEVNKLP